MLIPTLSLMRGVDAMAASGKLVPAEALVKANQAHFPNESAEYRQARNALLVKEIELRRQIEEVSALRRQLPPGGEVTKDYRFVGESGPIVLSGLFAGKDTLILYNYMFGPQRQNPCPSCTSYMATWENKMADIEQRASFVMVARSPIERLIAAKQARGWTHLKLVSDPSGEFTRDY